MERPASYPPLYPPQPAVLPLEAMHPSWHVLHCSAQRELIVAERLTAAGFGAFVPLRQVWRAASWLRRRRELSDAPLLSRYVFLQVPVAQWGVVLGVPDVWGVLTADGAPAVVADRELAELRRQGCRAPILVGDVLTVERGIFAGHDVVASAVDVDRRNITADVTLLGSRRPVQISVDQLAA